MKRWLLITGGVNEHIFDKYFIDIAAAAADESEKNKVIYNYFNKPAKDYFFNKIVFIYNAKENTWKNAGELPGAGTAGSSSVMGNNFLMLINGELKPGLRTDVIYRAMWDNDKLTWLKNSQLPPSPGETTAGRVGPEHFRAIVTVSCLSVVARNFSGSKTKLY
ncbi:N-acetylneuraminic acid mutarotase [Salmonella enterica subsp. enterica]|uniref:N-acetylneuraminic acid mutarotase n=1 Tax=Salmonella enterica I TaxID=59201 RepID=A0A3S4LX49_SALET|nr:N-acetylneuraminic acid mutarotase [Salmonella enterica subsp. enterica]